MKTINLLSMAAVAAAISLSAFADGRPGVPHSKAFPKSAPVGTAAAVMPGCPKEVKTVVDYAGNRAAGRRLVTLEKHTCPTCKTVEKRAGAGKAAGTKLVHKCESAMACCVAAK